MKGSNNSILFIKVGVPENVPFSRLQSLKELKHEKSQTFCVLKIFDFLDCQRALLYEHLKLFRVSRVKLSFMALRRVELPTSAL